MSGPTDVLACVDFSPVTPVVVDEAALLARKMGATLHLLHVAAPEPYLVGYDQNGGAYDRHHRAEELTDEHRRLRELAEQIAGDDLVVQPIIVPGDTVDTILAEAEKHDSALVVVGSHGHRALHRLLVGSIAHGLLRKASRPLVVVPAPDKH